MFPDMSEKLVYLVFLFCRTANYTVRVQNRVCFPRCEYIFTYTEPQRRGVGVFRGWEFGQASWEKENAQQSKPKRSSRRLLFGHVSQPLNAPNVFCTFALLKLLTSKDCC